MCCEIILNNNSCVTAQITLTCPQQAGHRCNAESLWGALQRLSTLLFVPNNAYLNPQGMKSLKAFNLHCYPSFLVSALMTLRWLICADIQKEWMDFCAQKRMTTMAKSPHLTLDLGVTQFSAEMPSASRGRASWTGNERGEEEALLLGGQHSPRQSWAWPTGTVSPAGTYGSAWCTRARFCWGSSLLDLGMPQAVRALFPAGPAAVLLQTTFLQLDTSKRRGSHQVGGILHLSWYSGVHLRRQESSTKEQPTPAPAKQSDMGCTGKTGQESNETLRNSVC